MFGGSHAGEARLPGFTRALVPREQLADDVDGYAARLSSTLTVHYKFALSCIYATIAACISRGARMKCFRVNGKREITLEKQRGFIILSFSELKYINFYRN